jgi:hypothetical protein
MRPIMHFSIAKNSCFALDGDLWQVEKHNAANKEAPFIVASRQSDGQVQSFTELQFSDWYFDRRLKFLQVGDSNRPVSSAITQNPDRIVS